MRQSTVRATFDVPAASVLFQEQITQQAMFIEYPCFHRGDQAFATDEVHLHGNNAEQQIAISHFDGPRGWGDTIGLIVVIGRIVGGISVLIHRFRGWPLISRSRSTVVNGAIPKESKAFGERLLQTSSIDPTFLILGFKYLAVP
jgi:hypothetical protein